jgi:tetraacyldisaccharide 4'-kinase
MGLKQALPNAWRQQAPWLVLLKPLAWLYGWVSARQRAQYQSGQKPVYRAPVPIMVIGNITVGGSGKTPLIIELVRFLQQDCGLRVGVISRGYGGTGEFPRMVAAHDDPTRCGDEPVLIASQTQAPVAVAPKRQAAIECLLAQHTVDLILSDDGLQHWAMARDLEWIVLDTRYGVGNGWLLPAGLLREPASRLQTATVIEHGASSSPYQMQLAAQALQGYHQPANAVTPVAGQTVHAVAGIGDPSRFFRTLQALGFVLIEHPFDDHHAYQAQDIQFADGLPVITTAKDAVKWAAFTQPFWVLPVCAQLSPACYTLLQQQLQDLGVLPPLTQHPS